MKLMIKRFTANYSMKSVFSELYGAE